MKHAAGLVTGHHIQIYRVDTVENAALNIRVVAAQMAQQKKRLRRAMTLRQYMSTRCSMAD